MVSDTELARQIRQQVDGKMVILYDRILRHRKITKNKSDTLWNINLNVPARSMKGILMLFEDPERTSTETYYNPNITKVEMTIEGVPNQLYSQGMKAYQQWDEINKFFALNSKRNKTTEAVLKDVCFSYTTLEKYLTDNFALWLDLRSTDDNSLHGSGRKIENASEGNVIISSVYTDSLDRPCMHIFRHDNEAHGYDITCVTSFIFSVVLEEALYDSLDKSVDSIDTETESPPSPDSMEIQEKEEIPADDVDGYDNDPDYIYNESEEDDEYGSDDEEETSNYRMEECNDPVEEKYYMVSETALFRLLSVCRECNSSNY
ncbi:Hypothetical predicted protein [Mytilus galloprovincialis]|uniref:Uncharacterized protein n=1 Tax=Mytilus galloprovincialis TaxID=29158 RepID=A0A8B6BPP3_MYTGA|nr:Hypothetical predicted protein [Mytilus galloprovincialis]